MGWPPELLIRLGVRLESVEGGRTSRLLGVAAVQACVEDALASPWGYAWRTGGEVGDPRVFTTVCLAVAGEREVVLGVEQARAQDATPDRAWPELNTWWLHDPPANVAAVQRWSRSRAGSRIRIPRVPPPPGPDAATFLERIREHPEDDQPRRVYADWLLEHGDPRGEFISLQLARPGSFQEMAAVAEQVAALLAEHRQAWLGPLAAAPAQFERGFLERLTLGADQAPLMAALLEREPVHTVVAAGAEAALQVAASGWLARVHRLEVVPGPGRLEAGRLERLLDSPFLGRLDRLRLAGQPLGDAGAARLAARWPSALPRLRSLTLEDAEVGPVGLGALLESPGLRRLEALQLIGCPLGSPGLELLAAGSGRLALRRLRLDRVQAGDPGARALAGSARLGALEALSLRQGHVGPQGAGALLESTALLGLRSLDLAGNPVGERAERILRERFGADSRRAAAPW